jgi:hypothetical protein
MGTARPLPLWSTTHLLLVTSILAGSLTDGDHLRLHVDVPCANRRSTHDDDTIRDYCPDG